MLTTVGLALAAAAALLAVLRFVSMSKQTARITFVCWISLAASMCYFSLPVVSESLICFVLQFPLTALTFVALSRVPAFQRQSSPALDMFDDAIGHHARVRHLQHPEPIPQPREASSAQRSEQASDSDSDVELEQAPAVSAPVSQPAHHTPPSSRPPAPLSELDRFLQANNLSMQQVRETSARKPRSAGRRSHQTPARVVAFTPDTRLGGLDHSLGSAVSRGGLSTLRGPSLPPTPIGDSTLHGTLDASFAESTGMQRGNFIPETPAPVGGRGGSIDLGASTGWGDISAEMHSYASPEMGGHAYLPVSAGGSAGRRSSRRRRR